jgi:hypothetical protein
MALLLCVFATVRSPFLTEQAIIHFEDSARCPSLR